MARQRRQGRGKLLRLNVKETELLRKMAAASAPEVTTRRLVSEAVATYVSMAVSHHNATRLGWPTAAQLLAEAKGERLCHARACEIAARGNDGSGPSPEQVEVFALEVLDTALDTVARHGAANGRVPYAMTPTALLGAFVRAVNSRSTPGGIVKPEQDKTMTEIEA